MTFPLVGRSASDPGRHFEIPQLYLFEDSPNRRRVNDSRSEMVGRLGATGDSPADAVERLGPGVARGHETCEERIARAGRRPHILCRDRRTDQPRLGTVENLRHAAVVSGDNRLRWAERDDLADGQGSVLIF